MTDDNDTTTGERVRSAVDAGRRRVRGEVEETHENIREMGDRAAGVAGVSRSTGRRASYAFAAVWGYTWFGVTAAAAQTGISGVSPGDAMMAPLQLADTAAAICDSPLGTLLSLVFAVLALKYLYGGAVNVSEGLDKRDAVDEQKQQEGEQHMRSAKGSFLALAALIAIPVILEIAGVQTADCVSINPGVTGGVLFLVPGAIGVGSESDSDAEE